MSLAHQLLVEASNEQILCIIELHGNINISQSACHALYKSRVILKKLSKLEEPEEARKKIRRRGSRGSGRRRKWK
jgi:hypothetical protein